VPLQVGSPAPSFKGRAYVRADDRFIDLTSESYRGRWLALLFYNQDFSSVCPTELAGFDALHAELDRRSASLVFCSCDSVHAHKAWCDAVPALHRLASPMLSDMTKRIAMDFGVLLADRGVPLRGSFLIDPQGVLRWHAVYDLPTGRSTLELMRVLDVLRSGEPCGCDGAPVKA
jgi:peroxiredoxin (alkyl hydroperoxide reductase subunit C)